MITTPMLYKHTQAIQQKSIVVNRHTKITESTLDFIAQKLFTSGLPCLESMQVDEFSKFKDILRTECIMYDIPLIYVLDGGYRRLKSDMRVTYFGPVAIQLWNHMATKHGAPTVRGIKIKYILQNPNVTAALQPYYDAIGLLDAIKIDGLAASFLVKSIPEYKELIEKKQKLSLPDGQRIISIPQDMLYGMDNFESKFNTIKCVAGTYDLVGAIGELIFSDPAVPNFSFQYELDKAKTKLVLKNGRPSAYAISPMQFISTKFKRHAMQAYYNTILPAFPNAGENDDEDYVSFSNDDPSVFDTEESAKESTEAVKNRIELLKSRCE